MAYAPIAKLEKFTGKEDDAQAWLNDIEKVIVANGWNDTRAMQAIPYFLQDTANLWYQSLVNKPQDFNAFKIEAISSELLTYDAAATLLTISILNANLLTNNTSNLLATATTHLSAAASGTEYAQNPNSQNYLSLLIIPEDAQRNNPETNQYPTLTNNILPVTITENKLLDTIFLFELEEPSIMPLFSKATLEKKLITAMYTNAKVDDHSIKLILNSGSAGSIITKQLMDQLDHRVDRAASARIITTDGATKTPISEIDDFPFEVNGIIIPIKILVIEAIQYQALELQLSQNTTCSYFKTTNLTTPLIKFEKEEKKPTWKAYQISWADTEHNELPPEWKEKTKKKGKGKEERLISTSTTTYNSYTTPQQSVYCHPKLVCVDCGKKLSSIGTCCDNNEEYTLATKFYCCLCVLERFRKPKQVKKWNNKSCLACGETLLDEKMWNNILG
ncbi:hypothetical protein G9A89_013150 [Geosiphon pyriformis]|nr:hypothetical protein G9A89_013150 [Geosiphon pyriformis]